MKESIGTLAAASSPGRGSDYGCKSQSKGLPHRLGRKRNKDGTSAASSPGPRFQIRPKIAVQRPATSAWPKRNKGTEPRRHHRQARGTDYGRKSRSKGLPHRLGRKRNKDGTSAASSPGPRFQIRPQITVQRPATSAWPKRNKDGTSAASSPGPRYRLRPQIAVQRPATSAWPKRNKDGTLRTQSGSAVRHIG